MTGENGSPLGWSFEMAGLDRDAVLEEAGERLDLRTSHLGFGQKGGAETEEGKLARALRGEHARFAESPTVYRITDEDFLSRGREVPIHFRELTKRYRYYFVYFPISLFPLRNWSFNRLEVAVEFSPGADDPLERPKAYQILPDKRFQTLLQANDRVEVSVDGNFELSAKTGEIDLAAGGAGAALDAGGAVKASAGAGLVLGPFVYTIKRAQIDHTPVGMEDVFWRLDGTEFVQESTPALIVIAQVPKDASAVTIDGALQAYRKFGYFSASIQDAIAQLPRGIRDFFRAGAPLRDTKTWDVTELL
jgi:hypothetical protein